MMAVTQSMTKNGLIMDELRTTVRLNQHALVILDKAAEKWPEHAGNRSELLRQIAADWDRIRTDNGTTTRTQIAERLTAIEDLLSKLLGRTDGPDY